MWWFEASHRRATPKGQPSSPAQHHVQKSLPTNRTPFHVRGTRRFSPRKASRDFHDLRGSTLSHDDGRQVCLTNRFISSDVRTAATLLDQQSGPHGDGVEAPRAGGDLQRRGRSGLSDLSSTDVVEETTPQQPRRPGPALPDDGRKGALGSRPVRRDAPPGGRSIGSQLPLTIKTLDHIGIACHRVRKGRLGGR
jgi:hypothetical protein